MKSVLISSSRIGWPVLLAGMLLLQGGIAMADTFAWQTAPPQRLGLDKSKLDALRDELAARKSKALLVIRHDRIVYEWYADDHGPDKRHYTASLAKALVGGMSLLVALNDGRLKPDDPAWKYIPAWKDDPKRSKITIRHLATHSSGIEDANIPDVAHDQLPGWKGAFWRRDPDPFSIALHEAPVLFEPGARYAYSNPGMAALAYAVTASLKGAPESDIRTLLRKRIMEPIGVADNEWSIGYGKTYDVDGLKLVANWGGGSYTARAVARVGRLMLRKGDWQGRKLLDPAWVQKVLAYAGTPKPDRSTDKAAPASGLCWYTNFDGVWPAVPKDAFAGAGAQQQVLLVVPSLNLIVVRNGGALSGSEPFWAALEKYLFNPLMQAITDRAPYPRSEVIRSVKFDPPAAIVRKAIGSDNWPITWADDDNQYTSYGDGWGFEPKTDRKLSLGLARIIGTPEDFRGENIRSKTGERTGDGPKGAKASGMLMVDGVLYMWVRNVGNSQLAWSEDHGRTWQWGFKFETSFGCPTFLNFGKNYAGARDEYVYVYSQDGPSAYESYDQMVLARVPKDRIRDRSAYEFFVRLDEKDQPIWSRHIEKRGAVFFYPGHCQRSDVAYHPGIKRYLLALGFNHEGGWGIFDAPEPWGPWTTAFFTEDWGLGNTHGYRLPTKWMGDDCRTMYLIFSGRKYKNTEYDAFCVRRFTMETASSGAARPNR